MTDSAAEMEARAAAWEATWRPVHKLAADRGFHVYGPTEAGTYLVVDDACDQQHDGGYGDEVSTAAAAEEFIRESSE
jgi:hypothetical protein